MLTDELPLLMKLLPTEASLRAGGTSRRRDCHLMAPSFTCIRCFNSNKQGVSVK